ncbi:hypothetical protein [Paenibacillus validus]
MNMYDKAYELAQAALLDQIERLPPFRHRPQKEHFFFYSKEGKIYGSMER